MPEAPPTKTEPSATAIEPSARERAAPGKTGLKIVGIGASAGGLSALKRFFAEVPADTGAAFVVVVHMDPDRESNMEEVLQACANLRVEQVKRTLELQPDCIYVIPPGQNLSSVDSNLTLSAIEPERSKRAPIDHFLSTLAETRGEDAVGIVLSGTGNDGTEGLRHIRERGGLTLVQSPNDAEYDSMPQAAIAAGVVDLVLPADELAEHIARLLGTQPKVTIPNEAEGAGAQVPQDERSEGILRQIFAQIKRRKGHDFSRYRPSTILRRIRRRMQLLYLEDMDAYLRALRKSETETHALFDDLLITVTSFFRDPEIFQELETALIPKLFEGKSPSEPMRVWVAGCSTGEEAYSIAMLLIERARQIPDAPTIQIFASDLQSTALARARAGRYPESIEDHVSKERLAAFFIREKSGFYRVRKELREVVLFAPHNFLADPPFSRMDLISCRNVMIYLQRDAQREALELFHYALNAKGRLLLGSSESVEKTNLFRAERKDLCLFAKNEVHRGRTRLPSISFAQSRTHRVAEENAPSTPPESLGRLHHRILERLGPPSILIDQHQNILHLSENAGRYLVQQGGAPANQLFLRVRKELRHELRAALAAAQESKMPRSSKPASLRLDGRQARVVMRACPTFDVGEPDNYLIIFDEQEAGLPNESPPESAADVSELETEFELMQKGMQVAIEQYETSQEEMYAANEELQSSNEELRSTLEELETSKTELQSTNEELATASQENQLKVEELAHLTSDLQNLLVATDIATLFIDRDLRILRFTPRIEKFFNVRESDHGRPMSDLNHKLGAGTADLAKDARKVLESLQPIEREIEDEAGVCHLLRLLPYRSSEDKVEGVVITWIDVSRLKKTERALISREKELRKLTSSLALAEQNERDRIAHILHDDLQQALCALQMRLFVMLEEGKLVAENATEFLDSLSDTIDMTRALTVDMSPPVLKSEGLLEALNWLKSQMKKLHNLDVTLVAGENLPPLRKEHRSLLFQIVRELLFNVVKHARVSAATVSLASAPGALRIEISDKGAGSARLALEEGSHLSLGFGLSSIIERIALFEGKARIRSVVGEGTTISIELPVRPLGQADPQGKEWET